MISLFFSTKLSLTILALFLRNLSFHYLGSNFTHQVSVRKKQNHVLITSGIYAYERHPSYLGFFMYALGTQMYLGNPVSLCVCVIVLNKFFKDRVEYEEYFMEHFFDEEFTAYKQRTFSFADFLV